MQDGNLSQWAPTHKVALLFHDVGLRDNFYLSTVTVYMTTKLGRVVTYFEGLQT